MNNSSISNWSNLPRNIIYKIGNYTYKYFIPNLRLVNKHWSSAIDPIFFYSISNFDPDKFDFIVSKYSRLIGMLDSFDHISLETMNKILGQASYIDKISWWFGEDVYLDRLIDLLKVRKGIKSITLADDEEHDIEYIGDIKWDNLINILKEYSSVESFFINLHCTYLMPFFSDLPLLTIKNLELKIDSNQIESTMKVILKCDNLRRFKLKITSGDYENDDIELPSLVNPRKLIDANLEYFHLLIDHYHDYIDIEVFKNRLNIELFDLFSNPNFSKLKCYDINFMHWDPNFYNNPFTVPLTGMATQWVNLTKMCLFSIDKFILGHVIGHCPNLRILTFKSPLLLPYNYDSSSLKPLKYLTKMLFSGFQSDILNYKEFIRSIFPSVTTLSLYDLRSKPDDVDMKPYYIPNLFPNLIRVIFTSTEYNFEELIDTWEEDLSWEELCISIDKSNEKLVKSLLPKLTRLKNLYINHYVSSDILRNFNSISTNFKTFIVDSNSNTAFDFNIEYELS